MSRKLALCAWLLATANAGGVFAQEDLLSELYGVGVHAYNSGEYRDAYENLSAAVEGGSRDPRVYYFRGLSQAQLGRPEDARLDFAKGAQFEVAGGGDRYPIGRALERVQGAQRLTIERVRQIEKIKYQQAQLAETKRKYEDQKQIRAQEPVLREATPADVPPPSKMIEEGAAAPVDGDPFGDDGLGVGAAEPAPVRPTTPVGEDPAAGEEGGDDPFGAAPAGEEPAAGGDDPFGGEPVAGEDPFGGDAGDEEPAEEEPAPADDDPFGAEEPTGEEPATEEPADDAEPADEGPAAEDDPFGEEAADEEPAMEEEPAAPAGDADLDADADEDPFADDGAAAEGDDPFGS